MVCYSISISLVLPRAEREAASHGTQPRVNKLVSPYSGQGDGGGSGGGNSVQLTQAVRQLCRQADAFILVVDPRQMEDKGQNIYICIPGYRRRAENF